MLPQLSELFHQHKKHLFTLSPSFLLQMTSDMLYSLHCGNKLLAFKNSYNVVKNVPCSCCSIITLAD